MLTQQTAKSQWQSLDNSTQKAYAIQYAKILRLEYPEKKNPHSKAKIPFDNKGNLILCNDDYGTWSDAAQKYIKTPVTYGPSLFWCDAFETVEFIERYKAETVVRVRSLIDNVMYYISIGDYGKLYKEMHDGIFVGRWTFQKHGKTTKITQINFD